MDFGGMLVQLCLTGDRAIKRGRGVRNKIQGTANFNYRARIASGIGWPEARPESRMSPTWRGPLRAIANACSWPMGDIGGRLWRKIGVAAGTRAPMGLQGV